MRLGKKDLPYTIAMVVLDILAPILLIFGIKNGPASNASLLGNFEIVATTLIALLFFKEKVSGKLWSAIGASSPFQASSFPLRPGKASDLPLVPSLFFLKLFPGVLRTTVPEVFPIRVPMRLYR